ncbi:ABC transporter permease [Chitinophaga pendula]|uniref:ABC transporter permease n=1 Tax=Chitinophaga TaxID=79328 RepID=UPI000BAF574D|nr:MULTISPECIES: ABC transporter permease [Chitinophaga]ASZ13780.1 ABC transporter permease [Chitinophaga sp. MD30]UCJ08600.1 ABC transporter permease [Chitinophaga pendula]
MIRNYLKIAFRNLTKYKVFSTINITGLSVGMAVTLLIGLWVWDEITFNKSFENHDRIAQVMQHQTFSGNVYTYPAIPVPLRDELKNNYGNHFKHVVLTTWNNPIAVKYGDKVVTFGGLYMDPDGADMLSLPMLKGKRAALEDPHTILIDETVAKAIFGDEDPIDKIVRFENRADVKIGGVYKKIPDNSSFAATQMIASWKLVELISEDVRASKTQWGNNSFQLFVQVADNADMTKVSALIREAKLKRVDAGIKAFHPLLMLHPMDRWHLYGEFKNAVNTGGWVTYVRLFGIIGVFVLLLACINFMNLSTARSEKRAREVGIRKAIGSQHNQLIMQFFSESVFISVIALLLAQILVQLSLPTFNEIAGKKLVVPWSNPIYWGICLGFTLLTGLIAGSYPAFYLSSFRPVKVLKGTFRAGRFAAIPRKTLVVAQFAISVILIIGTIIVFRQIQYAQNRPTNYNRDGLVSIPLYTEELNDHFDALRNELTQAGVIKELATSGSPITEIYSNSSDLQWKGKPPGMNDDFANVGVSYEFGKTMDWKIKEGRDFSRAYGTDSLAMIINETAARYMNLSNPVGEIVRWNERNYHIIGVIHDMLMQSPYEPVKQTIFYMRARSANFLNLRLAPGVDKQAALEKLKTACKRYAPDMPYSPMFIDQEYARKFDGEKKVGKLAAISSLLAIFISCLGLFGMASFMAEQRIKEIGVRKVLGASVFSLWRLLSKEFVLLTIIALFIALPVSWYLMHEWLQHYYYQTAISWWIFAATAFGALMLTLLTVSYQSISAALHNPVKSLRSE